VSLRHARLSAVAVGCGATEHVRRLAPGPGASVVGEVVAVFERVIYVGFERAGGPRRVFAVGDASLRAGPLLAAVELGVGGWRQTGISPGDPCHLRPGTDGVELAVGSVRVCLPESTLGSLPVGQSLPAVEPARFQPGRRGYQRHRDLLDWLREADATDGLGWLDRLDAALAGTEDADLDRLVGGLVSPDPCPEAALETLVGRGPGTTPAGDDVLCGLLVAARCLAGVGRVRRSGRAVARAAVGHTPPVSRELLRQASLGRAAAPYRRCLEDLLSVSGRTVPETVEPVLDIGHTSGCALLAGTLTGTLAVAPAVTTTRRGPR
jgi:hypothetical protein